MTPRGAALACSTLVLWFAGPVDAGRDIDSTIAEAKRQYAAQEYAPTIRLLEPLVDRPDATVAQQVDALEILGLSYLIIGDEARARRSFRRLLELDPAHALRDPSGSPKLLHFFDRVKRGQAPERPTATPVELSERRPQGARAGEPLELMVQVVGGELLPDKVVLRLRRASTPAFRALAMTGDGQEYRTRFIPAIDPDSAYTLEYYFEATGPKGDVIGRLGTPAHPLSLPIARPLTRPRKTPVYRRWWFWTAVGAAVVGGVAIAFAASGSSAPAGNLPPGIVSLP